MRVSQKNVVKTNIGSVFKAVPANSGGVAGIDARGWVFPKVRQVHVRIKMKLAKTHKGRPLSVEETVDWPQRMDLQSLRTHVGAVGRKYYRRYMSGEWPVRKSYLKHCNPKSKPGFIQTNCAHCDAHYCTVEP